MPRRNALQTHMSKAVLARWAKIHAGESPMPTAGGRPPKPTACPRCGQEQPSATAAKMHCRAPHRGRPRKEQPNAA